MAEQPVQPEQPDLPAWASALQGLVGTVTAPQLSYFLPVGGEREAAVLVLFNPAREGSVLLLERNSDLRKHAGQVAFPGGSIDAGESPVEAALREAWEETGLDPSSVQVWGELPVIGLPVTNFAVFPVLAWWRDPHPLQVDPSETCRVVDVALSQLIDPAHRFSTRLRRGGTGPAFEADGLFIWGFTANLLSSLLRLAGLEQQWDPGVLRDVPASQLRA